MNEPAFPSFNYITQEGRENPQGMTLRDYFAAKAMAAFINCAKSGTPFGVNHPEINLGYAKASYAMADAMMEARNVAQ